MSEDVEAPPLVYEGLDPDIFDRMKETVHHVSGAIDAGRRPGMPLSILSDMARQAPLSSLVVAFLLGVAVARRR